MNRDPALCCLRGSLADLATRGCLVDGDHHTGGRLCSGHLVCGLHGVDEVHGVPQTLRFFEAYSPAFLPKALVVHAGAGRAVDDLAVQARLTLPLVPLRLQRLWAARVVVCCAGGEGHVGVAGVAARFQSILVLQG